MFKDINFKFAIISCLNEMGFYYEEAEAIKNNCYGKRSFDNLGYDEIVPAVYKYYKKLELDPEKLELIIEFNPSASNKCYNLLVKEWSGEDYIFNINSIKNIDILLPNLEIFNPFGLLEDEIDLKYLLDCKKLKKVYKEFIPKSDINDLILNKLIEKGIIIE